MALLDSCLCCSLMVASFVIGVYALVAYVIAFAVELWWIVESEGGLPAPAHLLCAGYFVSLVLCAVLLHGLTVRRGLCLVVWLVGVAALALPEAGMVLYMALQYWRLQSLYGLTEITCWACRLFINVAGVVSVQSLYSSWREESEVMRRLRDLNMSSTMSTSSGRRGSVASSNGVAHGLGHGLGHSLGHGYGQGYGQGFGQGPGHGLGLAFQNEGFVGSMSQLNGKPPGGTYSVPLQPLHSTKLKRSVSSASRRSTASAMSLSTMVPMAPMYNGSMYGYANPMLAQPMLSPLQAAGPGGGPYPLRRTDSTSEFNAAAFDGILAASLRGADAVDVVDGRPPARAARAQSLGDLSRAGGSRLGDYWRVESTTAPSRPVAYMLPSTRSLDRRPRRALSMADLHALQALVPMHGVPCYPDAGALVYPPALMLYRGATSKTSLGAASDDFRRYRDVAL